MMATIEITTVNDQYSHLHALIERNERLLVNHFQIMNNKISPIRWYHWRSICSTTCGRSSQGWWSSWQQSKWATVTVPQSALTDWALARMEAWNWCEKASRAVYNSWTELSRNRRSETKMVSSQRGVEMMDRLVRSGDTPEVAGNKICRAYGSVVTQIINWM